MATDSISRRDHEARRMQVREDHAWTIQYPARDVRGRQYMAYVRFAARASDVSATGATGPWSRCDDLYQASHWPTAEAALEVARRLDLPSGARVKDMVVELTSWGGSGLDPDDLEVFPAVMV